MLEITLQDTRVYQEAKAEGLTEGREEGLAEGRIEAQREMVVMLLQEKLIDISSADRQRIDRLDSEQLTELTKALLNFSDAQSLEQWLQGSL